MAVMAFGSSTRGDDLERVDNVTFDDLVEAYGTEYPIDVDPSTVELPEEVEDALM